MPVATVTYFKGNNCTLRHAIKCALNIIAQLRCIYLCLNQSEQVALESHEICYYCASFNTSASLKVTLTTDKTFSLERYCIILMHTLKHSDILHTQP